MNFKGLRPEVLQKIDKWRVPPEVIDKIDERIRVLRTRDFRTLSNDGDGRYFPVTVEDPYDIEHEHEREKKRKEWEEWQRTKQP